MGDLGITNYNSKNVTMKKDSHKNNENDLDLAMVLMQCAIVHVYAQIIVTF